MPTGTMLWFDPRTGEGRVVASGGEYPAGASDVEPRARTTGARVHFDIQRVDGVARAVRVTARPGTRTSTRQRRFGDLTGSAHPAEKGRGPLTRRRSGVDPLYVGRPVELVRHWIQAADSGRLDGLLLLYAPDAVLHTPSGDHHGRAAIRAFLLDSGLLSRGWSARPVGREHDVTAVRQVTAPDAGRTSRFRIAHGQIVEQWDEPPVDGSDHAAGCARPEGARRVADHPPRPATSLAIRALRVRAASRTAGVIVSPTWNAAPHTP